MNKPWMLVFALSSGGRTSGLWRAWTGSNKATDECYMSSKSTGGDLKVSLHKDGAGQIGLGPRVRGALFPGDRHALDRWEWGTQGAGVGVAFEVYFSTDQFIHRDSTSSAQLFEVPTGSHALSVIATRSHEDAEAVQAALSTEATLLHALPRRSLGPIQLFMREVPSLDDRIEEARSMYRTPESIWRLPTAVLPDGLAWAAAEDSSGLRSVLEFRVDGPVGSEQLSAHHSFDGEVLDASTELRDFPEEMCAALMIRDGDSTLLLNDRRRCDHVRLAETANELVARFEEDGPDDGWDQLEDGSWITQLVLDR